MKEHWATAATRYENAEREAEWAILCSCGQLCFQDYTAADGWVSASVVFKAHARAENAQIRRVR